MKQQQKLVTFKGNDLMFGRSKIGQLTRRRRGMQKFAFEPTPAGERLGLVNAFAPHRGIVDYVTDYLLRENKITDKQRLASRRLVS
jgi:hypothetical protein